MHMVHMSSTMHNGQAGSPNWGLACPCTMHYVALMKGWTFGVAVRTARNMAGIDQQELVEKLRALNSGNSWDQSKVSRIERGKLKKIATDDLVDLSRVQGMDYAWYLDGPSMADQRIEANPGQLKPTRRFRFAPAPMGFRPRGAW